LAILTVRIVPRSVTAAHGEVRGVGGPVRSTSSAVTIASGMVAVSVRIDVAAGEDHRVRLWLGRSFADDFRAVAPSFR
jgi:hypothetical protein